MNSAIEQLKLKSSNTFQSQVKLINQMIINNELRSALLTNAYFQINFDNLEQYVHIYTQITNTACSCLIADCDHIRLGFYDKFGTLYAYNPADDIWIIPGMLSGCLPVSSLLSSTLKCFYGQDCVDQIISYFSTKTKFYAMKADKKSAYKIDSNVQTMIENSMIEHFL
ncbi:unnamed protein product [Adineta ricciae]|uniref:Uncharacterized protein n=1 Tax=Adineta ricciae TaxID=249248 RepID=A0A814ADZ3_ADIRI|nr:unnamed protein product [Adineta ricciae]CAF1418409.1 unnamed protein product [Adineta ricciae]